MQRKSLVIGATGIIGNHIVRELLMQGHDVFAMSRGRMPATNLEGLPVKKIIGDTADLASLRQAFAGMDWVFQAAAYYAHDAFHKKAHVAQALQEVDNLVLALKESGVSRLVYTSSLTTIGLAKKDCLATEGLAYGLFGHDPHPYFLIKHLCEERLREAVSNANLPIIMINPTGVFGPFELKPRRLCLVPQLVKEELPVFVSRPINIVSAGDVAKGQVLAAKHGRVGERYILGGQNTNTGNLIRTICGVAGVRPPRFEMPLKVALAACWTSEFFGLLTKRPPPLSVLPVKFAEFGQHFSIEKARQELGYEPGFMEPVFAKAIEWYRQIGYC